MTEATLTAEFLDLAFVAPENSHDDNIVALPDVSPSAICIHPLPSHVHFDFISLVSAAYPRPHRRSHLPPYSSVHVDTGRSPHNPSPSNRDHPPFLPHSFQGVTHPPCFSLSRVPENPRLQPFHDEVSWLLATSILRILQLTCCVAKCHRF